MAVKQKVARKRSSLKGTVKDRSGAGKIKVGELLSKAGYITPAQLDSAKSELKKNGGRLGAILRQFDYIDDKRCRLLTGHCLIRHALTVVPGDQSLCRKVLYVRSGPV